MTVFTKLLDREELLDAIQNPVYHNLDTLSHLQIEHVCLDSRSVCHNALFVCYKGKNHDGHDFVLEAISRGASCVIVENLLPEVVDAARVASVGIVQIKSSIDTLFSLARYKRNLMSDTKFIAVTGSSGKTTVKNMIADCLSKSFVVGSSYKSYNNHFGVPLTILNLNPHCKVAVVEIGTNNPGEIEPLSKLVSPDIAVLTMIGNAHIGNFPNGIQDLIREKVAIFSALRPGGIAVLNQACPFFSDVHKAVVSLGIKNIVRVGKEPESHLYVKGYSFSTYYTTNIEIAIKEASGPRSVMCTLNGISRHNATNILFAFAIGMLFKIVPEKIAKQVYGAPVVEGRGNIEHLCVDRKKVVIINDTHNCSFEALRAALETLKTLKEQKPNRRVICFLGDMGETGQQAEKYHTAMAQHVIENGIDKVYCVGEGMRYLFDNLPEQIKGMHFTHVGQLIKIVRSCITDMDICLFKGKRISMMERAIDKLHMS